MWKNLSRRRTCEMWYKFACQSKLTKIERMMLPLLCLGIAVGVVAQNASSCTLARECDSTAKSHSATLMVGDRAVELDVASLSRARALAHLSTVSSRRQYNLKQEVDTLMSIIGETTTAWTVSIYCPVVASSLCYVSVHCSRLCRARYKACARGLTSHESATGGHSTHRVPTRGCTQLVSCSFNAAVCRWGRVDALCGLPRFSVRRRFGGGGAVGSVPAPSPPQSRHIRH